MVFNIKDFSAHINRYGTLQTNKFAVEIFPPAIFNPLEFERNTMTYRASSARIPGVSLDLQRVMRYGVGPEQKFPTNVNFTDISITFIDTVENTLWKRFATWINAIFDFTGPSGGSEASYATEYKKNYASHAIKIYVYDTYDTGNATKNTIVLKEAFPVSLSEVGVSWSENNKLYEFTVGFTFREWYFEGYRVGGVTQGAQLGPGLTTSPVPRPVESPRPQRNVQRDRAGDPFGLNASPGNETGTAGPVNPGALNF
jgi:hypothetical protein